MYQNVLRLSSPLSGWTCCKAELKFKSTCKMTDESKQLWVNNLIKCIQMKRDMLWHLFNVQMFSVLKNAAKQRFCFESVSIYE